MLPLLDRAGASSGPLRTCGPTATAARSQRRARILFEILGVVRDTLGTKLALGVRLCGDELIDGGTTITEAVAVARMVEEQGCADYVNTSIGVATATLYMIEASMHVPPGYASFIPSAFRDAVSLPVVGAGRYKDPAQAERGPLRRPLRSGRCGAGPDRRSGLRREGAFRSSRHDPAVPLLERGVRRPHGPQPLARMHREPQDRARRRRAPCARGAPAHPGRGPSVARTPSAGGRSSGDGGGSWSPA